MTEPELRLTFDAHPAGPRPEPGGKPLYLAVKIASAYVDHPEYPTSAQIEALLPWRLLPDDKHKFLLLSFRPGGAPTLFGVVSATAPARTPENLKFFHEIRTEYQSRVENLAKHIDFGWGRRKEGAIPGSYIEQGDEEVVGDSTDTENWPWLGMSSSLAALQASVSRDLHARWLIEIEGALLNQLWEHTGGDRSLLIVPALVHDSRDGADYEYRATQVSTDANGVVTTETIYGVAGSDDKMLRGYVRPLPGRYLRKDLVEIDYPDFANYWLTVADSRDRTLSDIDEIIASSGTPTGLAAFLPEAERGEFIEIAGIPTTPATKDQLDRFNAAALRHIERQSADSETFVQAFVLSVLGTLVEVEASNSQVADSMASQALGWWKSLVDTVNLELGAIPQFSLKATELEERIKACVTPLFRAGADPAPVLPGEGIDFLVGDAASRLIGERFVDANKREYRNELAEFGVFVRRYADGTAPPADGWRLVTGGLPVIDPNHYLVADPWSLEASAVLPHLPSILPRGIALAFSNGLLRNDDCYKGQLMTGPNALGKLNDGKVDAPDDPGLSESGILEFVSPGPVRATVADASFGLAPALRYGDWYDLAVFLIDRAGGMPRDISLDDDPTSLDFGKFAALAPPEAVPIRFLRRLPVGDLNVLPHAPGMVGDWPSVPKGVTLRAREWLDGEDNQHRPANAVASEDAPSILLNALAGANFQRARYSFWVEPPQIDEFTLQRWALPAIDLPPDQARAQLDELKGELERVAELRGAAEDRTAAANRLPHDPSVFGVAWQLSVFGVQGQPLPALGAEGARRFVPAAEKFQKTPIEIACGIAEPTPAANRIVLPAVPEGHFAILRLQLLVAEADHQRFDNQVLKYDALASLDCEGTPCKAHSSATIAIETATAAMPSAIALYDKFSLGVDAAANVIARIDAPALANLQFVHRCELERQRWVWRNLPNVTENPDPAESDERLFSSGLPLDLAAPNQATRDNSRAVLEFDAKAVLDRGFVMRPRATEKWPRTPAGSIAEKADLLVDSRDAQNAADYLRYGFKAVSRYEGLWTNGLEVTAKPVAATLPHPDFDKIRGPWRRVAAPYRGTANLRPLNILSILPLTAQPGRDASGAASVPDPEASTPFLVLLDEIWFREYGPGEALRAEIALEDREIGETDATRRPARLGPLPTKHTKPRFDALAPKVWTDEEAEAEAELRLRCFGPFGYSLDRTGTEALANATAFVVYVPDAIWKISPHWSVFIRFRRVLHSLSSAGVSPIVPLVGGSSGAYPLYTLADSGHLAMPTAKPAPDPRTAYLRTKSRVVVLSSDELSFDLTPYRRDGSSAPESVRNQYRYLLLLGQGGLDGGRGVEIFLPDNACWLGDNLDVIGLGNTSPPSDASWTRGQILEIEVDSTAPPGLGAEVDRALNLRHLFNALLPRPDERTKRHQSDAPGRVTRLSQVFAIRNEI